MSDLEEIIDEMFDCISKTDYSGEYTGYFAERLEAARKHFVRCQDCKRFSLDNSDHDYRSGWWCHRWNTDMVKPDGFCAWGERRDA